MANDDIFFENDVIIDVDLDNAYIIDQGAITKVVAHKYSSESTYNIGDYVIYRNELYKCVADISTPEEFDSTKWTKLFVVDELKNIYGILPTKADKSTTYTKTETDNLLNEKADKNTTYTKTETDILLNEKADKNTTYTKTETDNLLNNKANKDSVYTKTEIQDIVDNIDADISDLDEAKADKVTTYTKEQVDSIISNLPAPMVFKGTLGTGGTITELPTASSENEGFTYKVIAEGTYAGVSAKVGDMFTSNGSIWVYIPSGDETFNDTWRGIKVNGIEQLASSIGSGDVDFVNGTNSIVSFDASGNKIKINVDGYTQSQIDSKLKEKANTSDVYDKIAIDTVLLTKANANDVYTKTEVDSALNNKADKSTTYTKTEVDNALTLKADKADTYTKEEVDDLIDIIGTASGAIASFETNLADVLQSLKCEINAKQDLHGYDHPWAGGAGKNKLPPCDISGDSSLTITSDNGKYTLSGTATGYNQYIASNTFFLKEGTYTLKNFGNTDGEVHFQIRSADGTVTYADSILNPSTFTLSEDTKLKARITVNHSGSYTYSEVLTPQIELGSTATEYEPYSNICPIVGHSELNLTRCGVNLFDEQTETGYYDSTTGEKKPLASEIRSTNLIPVMPNTTYAKVGLTAGYSFIFFDSAKNFLSRYTSGGLTFTTPANCYYIGINFGANYGNTYNNDVSINYPATDTDYHAYNGQTFTVAFGQTVYGGVYDKSGRLTIDTVKVVLDGTQPIGLANWNPNTNTRAWIYLLTTFPDLKDYEITDLNISSCKLKADKLKTVTYQGTNGIYSNDIPSISIVGGDYWSIAVRVDDTSLETDTAINNYLSQNPIEVCYELATPIIIDVQAISPSAVVGTNNVFSDTGDTEVKYFKGIAEGVKEVFKNSNFVDLSDIPDLPNIDGSYRLNLTITNGIPVYSWEEIT